MNDFVIQVENLSHNFNGEDREVTAVLRKTSFSVRKGEFFTILGPSGCGKSTLLRIIAGMIKPEEGRIIFSSQENSADLAMIFQSFAIFPWLNVYENVGFGLRMNGMASYERSQIIGEHIQEMGLVGFEETYPRDLSGGMKQRVGIARALAVNPKVLLMDEAFSSLDNFTAVRLRQELLNLWLKDKITIVMVTHLAEEAVEMSDRVLVMTPRPGRVEAIMNIDLPRPRDKRSQEFFNLVDKINEIVKA